MKRALFLLFLIISICFNIYSQENNAISLNIENFTSMSKFGIVYERNINEYFSFALSGYFAKMPTMTVDPAGKVDTSDFGSLAHFRYYPFQTSMKNFFWDIGVGYKLIIHEDWEEKSLMHLFPVQTRLGWTYCLKKLFLQPYIGYNKDFGNEHYMSDIVFKYGYPIFGLSFGMLF